MNKLRIISLIIFILIGLTGFISHPCVASPELPKASISITSPTLYGGCVPYGQKIAVYVEIHVKKSSPVPLEIFCIAIYLQKPNGEWINVKKTINDKINPGEIKGYTFKLDYVADQVGTWKYIVELWTYVNNKWYKLDVKEGTFVVRPIPKAEVIIVDIGDGRTVEYGQKITAYIEVCVKKDSPVPLDGFVIIITMQKPNSKEWIPIQIPKNDKINPGESKVYTFKLNQVADRVGNWKFEVELFTKDKEHRLDYKKDSFKVYGVPEAEIEFTDVYGYTVTALIICAGLALALSRIIR